MREKKKWNEGWRFFHGDGPFEKEIPEEMTFMGKSRFTSFITKRILTSRRRVLIYLQGVTEMLSPLSGF